MELRTLDKKECIVMLYKWQLVGTSDAWDLVLFSDSDVNLFPVESDASRVAAHWREMAPTRAWLDAVVAAAAAAAARCFEGGM